MGKETTICILCIQYTYDMNRATAALWVYDAIIKSLIRDALAFVVEKCSFIISQAQQKCEEYDMEILKRTNKFCVRR